MKTIKFDTGAGDRFETVAQQCKFIACVEKVTVEFDFNGIRCLVDENTSTEWLYRDYSNAHIMEWKEIGPKCEWVYDVDTEIELLTRKLAAAKLRKVQSETYEIKCNEEKRLVDSLTKGVVLLVHSDKIEDYNQYVEKNSQDGYSRAVIEYGEAWAKLMQVEISKGKTNIADIADECQKPLGYLGITGFQYGCVVNTLSHFWVFGEELRKWHNKGYGISEDQKGVVNPAILTIAAP